MTLETYVATERLIEHIQGHFAQSDIELVKRACVFAEDHFINIKHPIGKNYIQYASEVAILLDGLGADPIVISAVMLYPPPMSEKVLDEIRKQFKGESELVKLIEEVFNLSRLELNVWPIPLEQNESKERKAILQKMFLLAIDEMESEMQVQYSQRSIHFQKKEKQVENLIRMFLAAATDIRALVIKLVDRMHFMKLLKDMPQYQQGSIQRDLLAKITIAVYAPLADRLGMWRLKSELEDMSFRLLDMYTFKAIANQLADKKEVRKKYINNIIAIIRAELEAFGLKADISGRAKHIYSIYQKMEAKQLTFEQINDLIGIRIIVDNREDCYTVQAIIHDFWPPITDVYDGKPGRDWIAKPKENQYQSLHTTIRVKDKIVEVQIRTHEMHNIAEYGIAAEHWRYKESKAYRKAKSPRVTRTEDQVWSKQLAQLRKSLIDAQDFATPRQNGFLKDWIFVVTPEGHVIGLRAGATPLDFAYRIHTDLGHRYTGAKVGGRLVRADYQLKNGDCIELLISRTRKGPSPEWLCKSKDEDGNMYYAYARTSQARSKIRHWFREHDETQKAKA